MPIQNFDFPGVAFRQTFDTTPATTLSMLGVVCVGTQYQLYKADSDAAYKLDPFTYNPVSSNTYTVEAKNGGTIEKTKSQHHLVVKNGAVKYADFEYSDNTAENEIDKTNTNLNTRVIQFTKPVADGDGGTAGAEFGGRGVRVGDPIKLSGTKTEDSAPVATSVLTTVLQVNPVGDAGYKQIVVGDTGDLEDLTKAEFCLPTDYTYSEGSTTFQLVNAADNESATLTILANLEAPLTALATEDAPARNGALLGGDFYIEFREVMTQYVNKLGIISSVSEISEVLGTPGKDNPLALAVLFAFNTSGNVVYFTGVRSETPEAYDEALDFLAKYDGIYSVIPVTEDQNIIKQCLTTCTLQSADEESTIRRVVWYGITNAAAPQIWNGTGTFTTGADAASTVTVRLSSFAFKDTARQVGDKLRMVNYPNTIWDIAGISGLDLTLAAGSVAPSDATDVALEIIRTAPTNADIIEDVNARRCTQSERAVCVWADGLQYNGEDLPNIYLAAAAAGMRCYEAPHRPLSNLGYDFFTLSEPFGMTKNQLKRIGANGIWIIANNQDGTPINMRQVTTAIANNINLDEESIIANADTIAMVVCWTGRSYVGNSNISPTLIALLEDDLRTAMDVFLKNASGSPYVGPQLLDWELLDIYQDTVNRDHVYANFECEPPKPFNKFIMNMRVI